MSFPEANSVKIPATFLLLISISFGHLIPGLISAAFLMVSATETAAATVISCASAKRTAGLKIIER